MGLKGLTTAEELDIVLDIDSAYDPNKSIQEMREAGATVWTVRNLAMASRTVLQDNLHSMGVDGTIRQSVNSTYLRAIQYSLIRVENFTDDKGKPIHLKLEPGVVPGVGTEDIAPNSFLDRLTSDIVKSLGKRIMTANTVSEEERKN